MYIDYSTKIENNIKYKKRNLYPVRWLINGNSVN